MPILSHWIPWTRMKVQALFASLSRPLEEQEDDLSTDLEPPFLRPVPTIDTKGPK